MKKINLELQAKTTLPAKKKYCRGRSGSGETLYFKIILNKINKKVIKSTLPAGYRPESMLK
jgi:hypothetical protein